MKHKSFIQTVQLVALWVALAAFQPSATAGSGTVPPNDDGSSSRIPLDFTFRFFGVDYTSLYLNNNGNLTFADSLSTYTPNAFPSSSGRPIIAPFWADVDTRAGKGTVTWLGDSNTFKAVWSNVGYFDATETGNTDARNTFSVTLQRNNGITFEYGPMHWTTGDASGGTNGFGGTPATLGLDKGTGRMQDTVVFRRYGTANVAELTGSRWYFQTDNAVLERTTFKQYSDPWASQPTLNGPTLIKNTGCFVSSSAMILKALGHNTDPGKLSQFLKQNMQGDNLSFGNFPAQNSQSQSAILYGQTDGMPGPPVRFRSSPFTIIPPGLGSPSLSEQITAQLKAAIDQYGPVIVRVPSRNYGMYLFTAVQATATAQVHSGAVVGAVVTSRGSLYKHVPKVKLQGGGGLGAAAVAEIANGKVTRIVITHPGSGYTSAPRVLIDGGTIHAAVADVNSSGQVILRDPGWGGTGNEVLLADYITFVNEYLVSQGHADWQVPTDLSWFATSTTSLNYTYADVLTPFKQKVVMGQVHSPVEVVLRDSAGRRLGFDPETGTAYNEIPGASYYREIPASDAADDAGTNVMSGDIGHIVFEMGEAAPGDLDIYVYPIGDGPWAIQLGVNDPIFGYNPQKVTLSGTNTDSSVAHYVVAQIIPAGDVAVTIQEASTPRLNRQTGLYEQLVTLSNDTGATIAGGRVLITGLNSANILTYNASGTNAGVPYVQYNGTLTNRQTVVLTIEYYSMDRVTVPNPVLTTEAVTGTTPVVTLTGTRQSIRRALLLADATFLVEFDTTPGKSYVIEYSSDMTTWKQALPAVPAFGSRYQWIDNGPPKTESRPSGVSRFYRVIELP